MNDPVLPCHVDSPPATPSVRTLSIAETDGALEPGPASPIPVDTAPLANTIVIGETSEDVERMETTPLPPESPKDDVNFSLEDAPSIPPGATSADGVAIATKRQQYLAQCILLGITALVVGVTI